MNDLEKTENDGGKNGKGEYGLDGLVEKKKVGDGATYQGDEEKRPGLQTGPGILVQSWGRQPLWHWQARTSRSGDRECPSGCEKSCDLPDGLPPGRAGFDSPPGPL